MSKSRFIIANCLLAISVLLGAIQPANAQLRERRIYGTLRSVNVKAGTIKVALGFEHLANRVEKTFPLATDLEVCTDAGMQSIGIYQPAKLADLSAGMQVNLDFSSDDGTVESIVVVAPRIRGILKRFDAKKNALTVAPFVEEPNKLGDEITYRVDADTAVRVSDHYGSESASNLDKLPKACVVSLELSLDKKHAHVVKAEPSQEYGIVKSIDAGKRSISIAVSGETGDRLRVLQCSKDVVVTIDDNRGRLLSLKKGKLADVPVGAAVTAYVAIDRSVVEALVASGPLLLGKLSSVSLEKKTVTFAVLRKAPMKPEVKTLPLAKDARILVGGRRAKLGDLKANDNREVELYLTLDQKAIQVIRIR